VNDRLDAVLASIDGALMDPEVPDGMRWSPAPEHVSDPAAVPYDGEFVPIPPQTYEPGSWGPPADRRPQSHAEGTGQGVSRSLPPGASMLLGQLRAEHAEISRRVSDHTPPPAVDHNAHVHALLRGFNRYDEAGLLIVEEYASGLTTVRRATPEETAEVARRTWAHLIEAFTPLVQQVGEAFRSMGDALRRAGMMPEASPPAPLARLSAGLAPLSPEEIRTAALDARRHRHTGPPPLGPERSRRPRTHR
jgi:hypothetical protein